MGDRGNGKEGRKRQGERRGRGGERGQEYKETEVGERRNGERERRESYWTKTDRQTDRQTETVRE